MRTVIFLLKLFTVVLVMLVVDLGLITFAYLFCSGPTYGFDAHSGRGGVSWSLTIQDNWISIGIMVVLLPFLQYAGWLTFRPWFSRGNPSIPETRH